MVEEKKEKKKMINEQVLLSDTNCGTETTELWGDDNFI